jgi:hypothetical protein
MRQQDPYGAWPRSLLANDSHREQSEVSPERQSVGVCPTSMPRLERLRLVRSPTNCGVNGGGPRTLQDIVHASWGRASGSVESPVAPGS